MLLLFGVCLVFLQVFNFLRGGRCSTGLKMADTCKHTHMFTRQVYICTRTHTVSHTNTCLYAHTCVQICIFGHKRTHSLQKHTHICTQTRSHTHTHTRIVLYISHTDVHRHHTHFAHTLTRMLIGTQTGHSRRRCAVSFFFLFFFFSYWTSPWPSEGSR